MFYAKTFLDGQKLGSTADFDHLGNPAVRNVGARRFHVRFPFVPVVILNFFFVITFGLGIQ